MTWLLVGAAVVSAGAVGFLAHRTEGWSPELHRLAVVVLMLPWFAMQASVAHLARSASLNPIRRSAQPLDLLPADLAAVAIVVLLLTVTLVWARRLRIGAVLLPVIAYALTWWVTVPMYAALMMRGWFFLTESLAGPGPLAYHLSATAFLAGYVLPSARRS